MESCIYEGKVRHLRLAPVEHSFDYRLFMMYLDLAELEDLFRDRLFWSNGQPNVASFQRGDHFGDAHESLDDSVRRCVQQEAGERPNGPIRLLTHMRYFGYCFNPVSFFYCFDDDGRDVDFILSEVNNTPWGETHPYVLDARDVRLREAEMSQFEFDKVFHVSPFMGMNQRYRWAFTAPGEKLAVQMHNFESGHKVFEASMAMIRRPITSGNLARVLIRFPFMTARIITAIYWQALQLRLKRVPFVPHPKHLASKGGA